MLKLTSDPLTTVVKIAPPGECAHAAGLIDAASKTAKIGTKYLRPVALLISSPLSS
jgi:hypothetical protein